MSLDSPEPAFPGSLLTAEVVESVVAGCILIGPVIGDQDVDVHPTTGELHWAWGGGEVGTLGEGVVGVWVWAGVLNVFTDGME